MAFVQATVALATVAATITVPILLLALRSAAVVAVFFPSFAIFALVWGLLFFLGILAFIPWLRFWCCLFCSVYLFSSLSPTVASLVCYNCRPPSLVVPVYVLGVSFCGGSAVFFLSSCWVWGRLLLSLFWCDCSAFFLGHLWFSTACHAAGYPSWVPHLADSGWLTYSCSGGLAWGWGCLGTDVLLPHLVFYLVPAQLPLRGSAPLAGASACLTPVCWSTPEVGLEGSLLRHLVFSHVPCSSSGPAACAAFPAAGSLGVFQSPGSGITNICLRKCTYAYFGAITYVVCKYMFFGKHKGHLWSTYAKK